MWGRNELKRREREQEEVKVKGRSFEGRWVHYSEVCLSTGKTQSLLSSQEVQQEEELGGLGGGGRRAEDHE